jgi:ABC-type uncharacterized transport system involved in gliding motility auxiliary subunit
MNRTLQAFMGAILILVITFTAIHLCQDTGKALKWDITEQKIYTLSEGTKNILARLHQPIKVKLFYAKKASLKATDEIRFFNNYYEFVKALLEEYVHVSKGMLTLEIIDPRPYTKDEEEALRHGLKRFPITQEETFFFGLVIQTPFGVHKVIPFFSPDRQNFIEYDISYLIDTAITREKKRLGIMSSLAVMGDDVSDYMAKMMAYQGQQPKPSWVIVNHLREKYEVKSIPTDINDVNDIDVDILMVVHPKDFSEKTLFAIDQFVLKGGRTIVFVDPHCWTDKPAQPQMQMQQPTNQSSNLEPLLHTWGLEMPENTFAGDRALAIPPRQRSERLIGYMELTKECFNQDNPVTAELNQVRILFAGVLQKRDTPEPPSQEEDTEDTTSPLTHIPLMSTTSHGNSWTVSSPYELAYPDASALMKKFTDGTSPVHMGYLISGRFPSSYPDGIEVQVDQPDPNDPNETLKVTQKITGLKQATEDCVVVVFSDVDFITDQMAYQRTFFGNIVVGDNSSLLLNTLEDLGGSTDLIGIRSRGNFRRPFTVVDEIEQQAEKDTAQEVANLNAIIASHNQELQKIVSTAKEGEEEVVGSAIVQKRREIELKIHDAKRQLNEIKRQRLEKTERLGNKLRQANMLAAPAVILIVAILLGIRRSVRKRHYISHASDA